MGTSSKTVNSEANESERKILPLVDTHAHLDYFERKAELSSIVDRAKLAGVCAIIACSTNPSEWELYKTLAERYKGYIFWQAGIHPTEINDGDFASLTELEKYFAHGGEFAPIALGEVGLDYHYLPQDSVEIERIKRMQKEFFIRQLEIAVKYNLKVCVHARDSLEDCESLIESSGLDFKNVVFHCFSGSVEDIKRINYKGARASFTGVVTYKSAGEMREAMLTQRLDLLMLETDCPYLAPVPYRGKLNEPSLIKNTAEYVSEIFALAPERLSSITTQNAKEFFGIKI